MAQVEPILRCGRTIQRGVLRLRGADGAVARKDRDPVIPQIRATADEIARDYRGGSDIVQDLCSAADALD